MICCEFWETVKPPIAWIMASPAQVSHLEVLASMKMRLPTYLLITLRHL